MTTNPALINNYHQVFKKWELSGYIEKIVDTKPAIVNLWYWAHFPIVKEEKETTKIRLVFDGAAKFRGVCINDYIRTGPSVMNK
jgi:hypothetical protein